MSQLTILHPHAGAIDIGASELYCNTYEHEEVEVFIYTQEGLEAMVKMFVSSGVDTVALEATGVYWLPVYEALESAGVEVYMVNGAHVKQLPGRKSDISDALWLRSLHQYGLLKAGFVPEASIRCLRSYIRVRDTHIRQGSEEVLRMHKALDLMGLKIHQVLSQIQGKSGLAILDAIVDGERDISILVGLTDGRVQKNKAEQLAQALKGNYAKEHLFLLQQALKSWRFHQEQMGQCDREIEIQLQEMTQEKEVPQIEDQPKGMRHNAPKIADLHRLLLTLSQGKNPTQIEGINDYSFLKLVAHTGLDMEAWANEKRFVSYAGLAPSHDRSGKRKRRRYRKGNKEVKNIFMLLARSVAKMDTELGAFYRQLKARKGPAVAMKALARKIAIRYYRIMKFGTDYIVKGTEWFEHNFKQQKTNRLIKQLKKLNPDNQLIAQLTVA